MLFHVDFGCKLNAAFHYLSAAAAIESIFPCRITAGWASEGRVQQKNTAKITNDVQCHSSFLGHYDCHI